MKRRDFTRLGLGVGIAAVLVTPVVKGAIALTSKVGGNQFDDIHNQPQGKVVLDIRYVQLRHPKHIPASERQPGVLFDGSVIRFFRDSEVRLPNGRLLKGKKNDQFRLVCIRDSKTNAITKRILMKGLTSDEVRSRIAARNAKKGGN